MSYQVNDDFQIVDVNEGQITGIGINKGKYAGVLYHYGKVKIKEEFDSVRLTFQYTILQSTPNYTNEELQRDEEFRTMLGDILTEIIINIPNEEIRNYYTEESDI